jgi:fibronectin type 3 domain-containing protein
MRHLNLLMAVCAGLAVAACDNDSPVQPRSPGPILFSTQVGSGLTASAISPTEIHLSWANSPNASGYQVFRSDNGAMGSYSLIASTAAAVASYANTGLTGLTQYCYEIRSFKTAGKNTTYSAYSSAACATTLAPPFNAPSEVDVVPVMYEYFVFPANSTVHVSWKDNSVNEDGFRLDRASTAVGPWTLAATTAANVTSLYQYATREQQVCFRVTAFGAAGALTSASADCTTPPAIPTNLLAKAADRESITLTWTDNSAVEDGYRIWRTNLAGGWEAIATVAPNASSYRDASVVPDRTYTYRVQALKDGGYSDYSEVSAAVISTTPPVAPFDAHASYWADNEFGWLYLDIAWTAASSNSEGFRIESSGDGVTGWVAYATVANITGFQLKTDLWASLTPVAGCYRVFALNSVGESGSSNVTCTEWYNPPTNLTAKPADQQSIDLSWTDNGQFERGYVVFRSTTVDGSYDFITETPANATTFHDTGLDTGQEYWYFVASDFGGESFWDAFNFSDRVSATTLSAMGGLQSSRTLLKDPLTAIRLRGRPTLKDLRARYGAMQTLAAIGAGSTSPIRVNRSVRQTPRIRGRKTP